jgi:hypothetical protein
MNFRLIETDQFRRHGHQVVNQRRPHVVGTTELASEFIKGQQYAVGDEMTTRHIFGMFYLGGDGDTLVDGKWVPSFRLQTFQGDVDEFLQKIDNAFQVWRAITGR